MAKKKKCKAGFSCGRTCIQRKRTCKSNLDAKGKKVVENYTQFLNRLTSESQTKLVGDPKPTPKVEPKTTTPTPPKKEGGTETNANLALGNISDKVSLTNLGGAKKNMEIRAELTQNMNELTKYGEELFGGELDALFASGDGLVEKQKRLKTLMADPKANPDEVLNLMRETRSIDASADSKAAIARLRGKLFESSSVSANDAFGNIESKLGNLSVKAKMELGDLERMTNGKVSQFVKKGETLPGKGRSYAESAKGNIALSANFNTGIAAHEAMHILEVNDPRINKFSVAYRETRRKEDSTQVKSMNEIIGRANVYGNEEVAFEGKYPDPYMGKVYSETTIGGESLANVRQPTEVTQMFVQGLFDNNIARHFAGSDREGFAAFLAMMKLTQQGN